MSNRGTRGGDRERGMGRGDQGRGTGRGNRGRGNGGNGDFAADQFRQYDSQRQAGLPHEGIRSPSSVPDNQSGPSQFSGSYDNNSSRHSYSDQGSFTSLRHQLETHLSFGQVLANLEGEYQNLQSKLRELEQKPQAEFFIADQIRLHATLHSMEEKARGIIPYHQKEITRIQEEDLKPITQAIEQAQNDINVSNHKIKTFINNQNSTLYIMDPRIRTGKRPEIRYTKA